MSLFFQSKISQSILLLTVAFVLAALAGCGKNSPVNKDAAIDTLQKKNIAISADSLVAYSIKDDLETVKLLVSAGADVNAKTADGYSALREASWAGKKDVVAYLLENKADVNLVTPGRLTALSAAVSNKQKDVALLLLDHGANPNIVDSTGSVPLIDAAWQNNYPVVAALLAKGADAKFKRAKDGVTPLKATSDETIVRVLKEAGATE